MSSQYGESLKLTVFGGSHDPQIGMTLSGVPMGLPVDEIALQAFLNRRAPGRTSLSTARKEPDKAELQTGIENGLTTGEKITAIIRNRDIKSSDYDTIRDIPRPGHADYTQYVKYGSIPPGGGHLSGRLTAPLCIAGGLCLQWLEAKGIRICAKPVSIGTCADPAGFEAEIQSAKNAGDSIGGIIECISTGLPAGLGEPIFGGMENRIAQIIFGIPGIKGLEFGSGFAGSASLGSENNDAFCLENGCIRTKTNHCGGILGGITNGMPLIFRVAVKPTPSITKPQESISLTQNEPCTLEIHGRHDPCIVPRAVPVVEAASAIAIFDAILSNGEELWKN